MCSPQVHTALKGHFTYLCPAHENLIRLHRSLQKQLVVNCARPQDMLWLWNIINLTKFRSNLPSEIFQVITSSCTTHPYQRGDQLVVMFTYSLMVVIQCVHVITFPHNGYCDWLIWNCHRLLSCTVDRSGIPGGGEGWEGQLPFFSRKSFFFNSIPLSVFYWAISEPELPCESC